MAAIASFEGDDQSPEPDQFSRLVDQHLPALSRRAQWLAGDHDQAQDLIQEVLLRAWRSLHRLQSEAAARGWLYQILQREHLRSLRRRLSRDEEPLAEHHLNTLCGGDSGRSAEAGHDCQCILQSLPAALRQPLLLSAVEGCSNTEIAQKLKMSRNAVNIRLHRARRLALELAEA